MAKVRTRFAPSPTGYLHIGGARTALFSWLYARRHAGDFILRIEDTDRERSTPEAVDAILEGMRWLGLAHDEGPFYQTQRFDRYREVGERLRAEGQAYYCECPRARLEELRATQMENKEKPRYDGRCRDLGLGSGTTGDEWVLRFKNPPAGKVVVNDAVHGPVVFQNDELDDLVIARGDGTPTYNFTVVVDDYDMGVTHVIRGDDHLNNTPRQMNMLAALGASIPMYAHLPMILGSDGKRLSKRHGAVSVLQYRDDGYLPEALLNYLVRLGWSHGDQEIFALDELITKFDLAAVNKAAASINPEKLLWLNQHYLKSLDVAEIAKRLEPFLAAIGIHDVRQPTLVGVVELLRGRSKTLVEMAASARLFYADPDGYAPGVAEKHLTPAVAPLLKTLGERLTGLTAWSAANIHAEIDAVAQAQGLKLGAVAQPLRVAVTGTGVSPPIDVTVELLGSARTRERIDRALTYIAGLS
jgi:glutamyl-tRNA synthetase